MQLTLDRASDVPLYRQVAEQVRELIRAGILPAGERLPTVRQLAEELGLTRLTVQSAYAELQAQGLIESFVGRGTYVAARPEVVRAPVAQMPAEPPAPWLSQGLLTELVRMTEQPDLLSLAQAIPAPETYPLKEFGKTLRAALADPAALSYGSVQGEAGLREQVGRALLDRGLATPPEHVLITSGAQQGIDLALRVLARPGDVILAEEPTYTGAIELATQRRQRLVGVPMNEDGLDLAALEAACRMYRPRLLYTIPTFHNPMGVTMSAERRAALLRVARAHDLMIVEDDVYGLLAYDGPAPPPLKAGDDDGRVFYVTSFSKTVMPGLRLGAVVAPPRYLPELVAAKQGSDLISSPLLQRALADYLRQGHLPAHLQRVRALYAERRDALLGALRRHLSECTWTAPRGGLSIWVTLPAGMGERDFYLEAVERGVGVARGQAFFPQPQRGAHLRLSFGAQSPERIERGVALLGGLLREHLRRHASLMARASRESTPLV
jgi:DNA-binding transcriptional MocR family regulator